jgi:hypothetical protein
LSGTRAGFAFAALVALWPTQVYAAVYVQPLTLAVLLFLTTLWVMTSKQTLLALVAGLLAGVTVLTEAIFALPLLAVILLVAARKPGHALLVMLGAITIVTPWMVRNSIVQGQLTGITNAAWRDAFAGNGDGATGSTHLGKRDAQGRPMLAMDRLSPQQAGALRRQPEARQNALFRTWTLDWIRSNPLAYAKLCVIRIAKLLWLDWHHPLGWNILNVASRTLALAGFIVALARCRSARLPACRFALAMSLALVLATMFTLVEARQAVFMDIPQLLAIATLFRGRTLEVA